MNAFATHPAFTQPASQPVLRFLGSPEQLLVSGQQSGGEFALFQTTGERGHAAPRHRHRHRRGCPPPRSGAHLPGGEPHGPLPDPAHAGRL